MTESPLIAHPCMILVQGQRLGQKPGGKGLPFAYEAYKSVKLTQKLKFIMDEYVFWT